MIDLTASRFAGKLVMLAPEFSEGVAERLRAMAAHPQMAMLSERMLASASMADDFWPAEDDWMSAFRPYTVVNGVLQIPVRGVLLHDFPYQFWDYATGYKYIERAFMRGIEDPAVTGIAFVIDSPGGEVAGCFDAADRMVAAKTKPVRSFAHEGAYSAAFAMACVGDHIVVSRTGGVGSVGVVTSHADYSKYMEKFGVKITFIHAGKYKVEGNPYEPLAADAKERIQAHIDELYGVFVAFVAKQRSMSDEAVRATEALCYSATEAKSVGFADSIGALDEQLADWSASLKTESGDITMSTKNEAADNAANEAAVAQAKAEGTKAGATAERERIAAILDHAEAADRASAAKHIALKTDMSVEAAAGLLATLPKDNAKKGDAAPAAFAKAMEQGNPDVGADVAQDTRSKDEQDAERINRAAGRR